MLGVLFVCSRIFLLYCNEWIGGVFFEVSCMQYWPFLFIGLRIGGALFCFLFSTTVYLGVVGRPVRGNGMGLTSALCRDGARRECCDGTLEAEFSAQSRASPPTRYTFSGSVRQWRRRGCCMRRQWTRTHPDPAVGCAAASLQCLASAVLILANAGQLSTKKRGSEKLE